MNSRKDIQRELEQISSSLPLNAKMPVFDLPQGYFENFAAAVLAIVHGKPAESASEELAALSPLLAGLPRQTPFALPENYFNENMMLPPVAADEQLPAVLQQARNMPYAVPQGYFQGVAPAVWQQVAPAQKEAPVVSMFSRTWVRYAAAAVVTGALFLGSLLYQGNDAPNPASQPEAWVEKKLRNVSSEELEDFIEVADLSGTETAFKQDKVARPEVRRMLQDVPVSELDAFLEQVPAGAANL